MQTLQPEFPFVNFQVPMIFCNVSDRRACIRRAPCLPGAGGTHFDSLAGSGCTCVPPSFRCSESSMPHHNVHHAPVCQALVLILPSSRLVRIGWVTAII